MRRVHSMWTQMTRVFVLLVAFLVLAALPASAAQADDMTALQQKLQQLTQTYLSCTDDACRTRVQGEMMALGQKMAEAAAAAAGQASGQAQGQAPGGPGTQPGALPPSMSLPIAGPVDPKQGRWRLYLESRFRTDAPGVTALAVAFGEAVLAADANGVLTGTAILEAEEIISDPPNCQSNPMTGSGTAEMGGLIDGKDILIWILPGSTIPLGGRMVCTVNGQTSVHETESTMQPEHEFSLVIPVQLANEDGETLYTTGDVRGSVPGSPRGAWERALRLSLVTTEPQAPVLKDESFSATWMLEHEMTLAGHTHHGDVAFMLPNGPAGWEGLIDDYGPLTIESGGLNAGGRLVLKGKSDGRTLSFIPRATIDDIDGPGTHIENAGQLYFNTIFHTGDHRVTLPLKDGAVLRQGPSYWRVRGLSKCKLTITAPKKGKRFMYSADDNASLNMTFKAKVEPAKFAKHIEWRLPKFGAGDIALAPQDAKGPELQVSLFGLPDHNSYFGPKQITALIRTKECVAVANRTVKLFYPRDAENNPGQNLGDSAKNKQEGYPKKVPNWFYYWSQTSARVGPHPIYGGRAKDCNKAANPKDPDTAGYYPENTRWAQPNHYLICDLTSFGATMPFNAKVWGFKMVGETQMTPAPKDLNLTGIDTFALTSLHEDEHRVHSRKWWQLEPGQRPKSRRILDGDGDGIPNAIEPELNKEISKELTGTADEKFPFCIPGVKKTWGELTDEEFYIEYKAHRKLKKGAHDGEDWSFPGKQWTK